ncbi:protein translocase subunit SecF [Candidatus Falkowbacteria bacterium]|uniref:Protein-export membrane protein SecF n=1 Tax=Candidatus Falkowbacteria bacterium CG10_big_fil_rev_8_21_14_0_10_37_18 TaxID=1974562 RepID=A0A2H0VAI0_9BACT|nr:protein translocase subunit SecF [Candidatus Falkowbacteria bacterium]NCQ12836.1 protein translocase subunit SecF [Candidatus Falkowbacteria bacterium]OIO05781.1 MAG: protein-export membrane protein SecF [Candidatus Falkowbacteria bacterium CG1_02_37_21]PIR95330.1 MAG: protein translocase subunit SecF [Candidatus Falkowbacteria bacterium CG10_big_fil_rev_8_21_14_0_10_37_18]
MIRIIQSRKIFLSFAAIALAVAIYALVAWGLRLGLDFTGGSLLEVSYTNYQPSLTEVQGALSSTDLSGIVVQPTADSVLIRFQENTEEAHQAAVTGLQELATGKDGVEFKELQFESVGPSIGQELKQKSFNAIALALIMIILYITLTFRKVSRPVASWKFGLVAISALAYNIIFTLGAFAALGHFQGVEINTPFIAALLTIIGYDINDTIIVFDRIRENLPKSQENFEDTVNRSVNQTLSRSINTSFTVLLALFAIFFFGGASIRDFTLAMIIGVTVGAYTSIFFASPILVMWDNFSRRQK